MTQLPEKPSNGGETFDTGRHSLQPIESSRPDLSKTQPSTSLMASDGTPIQTSIDPALVKAFGEGASSLVAKPVLDAIDDLKNLKRPDALALWSNPKAALSVLSAAWGEADAFAQARAVIARSALEQVRIGDTDIRRDTLLVYMKSLSKSLSPLLPDFYRANGLNPAPSGSIAEMYMLVRLNASIMTVKSSEAELSRQMHNLMLERVRAEGSLTIAREQAKGLPGVIAAERESMPLVRERWFQKVTHGTSKFFGTGTSFVGGIIIGIVEGVETSWNHYMENRKRKKANRR